MRVIALLPVRNEAWVLPHSLACLTQFCDVVIVCDQNSTDDSRAIAQGFPKVVVVETEKVAESASERLPQSARWRLLDAARQYAGNNLIWISDADEMVAPTLARQWLERDGHRLKAGAVVECLFYNLWNDAYQYRDDASLYRPHWKPMAFVDDRQVDYSRSPDALPLHEPRLPLAVEGPARADNLPVLHLQWLIANRNQMKQAWYRCIELIDGRSTSTEINRRYSITLPAPSAQTTAVPSAWLNGVTFPDFRVDDEPGWHEAEVLDWFNKRGIQFFEPLEIWHIPLLRDEFRRRVGRAPRPDRSYLPSWSTQARRFGRRMAGAAWRRVVR